VNKDADKLSSLGNASFLLDSLGVIGLS